MNSALIEPGEEFRVWTLSGDPLEATANRSTSPILRVVKIYEEPASVFLPQLRYHGRLFALLAGPNTVDFDPVRLAFLRDPPNLVSLARILAAKKGIEVEAHKMISGVLCFGSRILFKYPSKLRIKNGAFALQSKVPRRD